MTQIGLTGRKISQNLDKELIENGGMTVIDLPTIECGLASEHETMKVQMFGYPSIIVYNKHREKQHYRNKLNKNHRENNKYIKKICSRLCGETFPEVSDSSSELNGVARGRKS